eukprot:746692-Amphidinium_carterae.1
MARSSYQHVTSPSKRSAHLRLFRLFVISDDVEVTGGSVTDTELIDGVAFKKTFSYAGFEQQPKKFDDPKILLLNLELELKAEKDNAEVKGLLCDPSLLKRTLPLQHLRSDMCCGNFPAQSSPKHISPSACLLL